MVLCKIGHAACSMCPSAEVDISDRYLYPRLREDDGKPSRAARSSFRLIPSFFFRARPPIGSPGQVCILPRFLPHPHRWKLEWPMVQRFSPLDRIHMTGMAAP